MQVNVEDSFVRVTWSRKFGVDAIQYTRTDIADAAHRAGYELARASAAECGWHLLNYDVMMKKPRPTE